MVKPAAPLVEPLGRQLVFTAKAMREAFEDTLTAAGGSLGTWIVLSALSDVGCMNQAALASHVHLEGATITHHIDRLEAAGLVRAAARSRTTGACAGSSSPTQAPNSTAGYSLQ